MSEARARAERFLHEARQFRLGGLLTEAAHPRSAELSDVARRDAAAGLGILFDVDRDVVERFSAWSQTDQPQRLRDMVLGGLRAGGRIFFTGCGATGRLSIQLASIWRRFFQERRAAGAAGTEGWEGRAVSIMAGGDYALIKSVEGFEDLVAFGRKQLADHGVGARDVVVAITEGGETPFVIGTAWQGLEAGARVVFVYNNPDDLLREQVVRSREVIDEPRIEKVNLTTGPMAVTGSTRMQATSIQLCVLLAVLEMVLAELLPSENGEAAFGGEDVPAALRGAFSALRDSVAAEPVRESLARVVELEEDAYRTGGRATYFADRLAIDVLTDTTERSPTFCTPPFRKWDDRAASDSWAFLVVPAASSEEAWQRLLARPPQTVEWSEAEARPLVGDDVAERLLAVLREIGHRELMRFRIGIDGLEHRPLRPGDVATAIVSGAEIPALVREDGAFGSLLARAAGAGARTAAIVLADAARLAALAAEAGRIPGRPLLVGIPLPRVRARLDPALRACAKLVLNALSTCIMVRLGRVLGNRMIYVVPSNLKLIDRATRYIRDLAGVSYEAAGRALFEAVEHVEPRMRTGRAYPPPVGIAVMRLRRGIDLVEAEKRLEAETRGGHR
jgi:N-acetylmuramic acid 6-phosphate etherase